MFFGNPHQLIVQITSIAAVVIYSFAVTFILLKLIDWSMGLRVSEEDEK
ncbi:MAG: Ammonium transporter, partial [Candidatus Peregrinibacteria bacterium GW2011_GWA2_47_7]